MAALIDLYSDTKTRPSAGMREAIARAEVGDEQHREDPTVTRLCERAAALLGQEDAIYLPSGTMANEIAVCVHVRPGGEVLAHELAHMFNFEAGAPAALAGAMIRTLEGERGLFTPDTLRSRIRAINRYIPRPSLLVVEQTANIGGGTVWPLDQMKAVVEVAREKGLRLHMDGARIMNASVASGIAAADFAGMFDSVYLDFTKGLGAPLGAILAGRKEVIEEAWWWKQRMGGAMRQAGMMAAGCIYALDNNVDRLAEDHDNARYLATLLSQVEGLKCDQVDTNIAFIDVSGAGLTAEQFNEGLKARGARMGIHGTSRLRAVTHLDVSRSDIEHVAELAKDIVAKK
jgi:threonine aldolase